MKKLILIIIIFFLLVVFYTPNIKENDTRKKEENNELRAIFISYIELQKYIKNKDTNSIKENIDKMINNIKDNNFNMIILQVRSFSDAIYKSDYYPWSKVVSSSEGIDPGIDVLSYFIEKSHSKNIELHAWINPYRIRTTNDTSDISKDNVAYKWLNTNNVKVSDNGIYYNPASNEVINLIVNGVDELVNNYDIDGIHLDDYFYTVDDIDLDNYNDYKKTHNISLSDYRLLVVNNLIKKIHKITKKKNILFGISPDGNIDNNYNKNYADVYKWGSSNTYVDYLMPQLYYGFYNEVKPFYNTLKEWNEIVKNSNVKIIPALSLYKCGIKDVYAKSGENEWIENDDIIMRQIITSRHLDNYIGFSIFRYDYMFGENESTQAVVNEIKNIKKVM